MRKTACSALFTLQEFNSGELSCQPVKLVFVTVLYGCRVGAGLCMLRLCKVSFCKAVKVSFVQSGQGEFRLVPFR